MYTFLRFFRHVVHAFEVIAVRCTRLFRRAQCLRTGGGERSEGGRRGEARGLGDILAVGIVATAALMIGVLGDNEEQKQLEHEVRLVE